MGITEILMIPVNFMYDLFKSGWTTLIIILLLAFLGYIVFWR